MSLEIAVAYNGYLDVVMITLSLSYVCQSSIQKAHKVLVRYFCAMMME